jgi:hypothetical protein
MLMLMMIVERGHQEKIVKNLNEFYALN